MTKTDLRLKFCSENGVQYNNFTENLYNTRDGYEEWLESELLIHKNQKLDYEKLKEEVASREEEIGELNRQLDDLEQELAKCSE